MRINRKLLTNTSSPNELKEGIYPSHIGTSTERKEHGHHTRPQPRQRIRASRERKHKVNYAGSNH